jgi:hypothetical protein
MSVSFSLFSYTASETSTLPSLNPLAAEAVPRWSVIRSEENPSFPQQNSIFGRSSPQRESDDNSRRSLANMGRERCSSSLKKGLSTAARIATRGASFSFWRAILICGYAVFATRNFGEPSKCQRQTLARPRTGRRSPCRRGDGSLDPAMSRGGRTARQAAMPHFLTS